MFGILNGSRKQTLVVGAALLLAAAWPEARLVAEDKADKLDDIQKKEVKLAEPIAKGQRVFTCAHSFHWWVADILTDLCKKTGIEGHQQIGVSSIGGSQVIQHWNVPDDKNQAKESLKGGKVDVLTLSPIFLPDAGVENFARLALEHNKDIRILVQPIWLRWDIYEPTTKIPEKVDHNAITGEELRKRHEVYFKEMDKFIADLNAKFGKTVLYEVPANRAVIALREKIIDGKAPGLKSQEELFTDALGHGTAPLRVLVAYCNYAVMYRRSPVGLPVPEDLKTIKLGDNEAKLNKLLQELAWEAVVQHPLSGVRAPGNDSGKTGVTAEDVKTIPDLELWVAADDLKGKDGDAVAKWPDRTSHHWDLTPAGGKHTLALKGINGKPAVHFHGSQNGKKEGPFGAMLTDAKFFDNTWKDQMSIFLVARQDIDPPAQYRQSVVWSADAPAGRDKWAGLQWYNQDGYILNVHWIKDLWNCQCGDPMVVNVFGVAYDGAAEQQWINGMEYSHPIHKGSPALRGAFCLGNHILNRNGFSQFGGYISEVLIFKRGLTRKECQTVNSYLLHKYNKTGKQIVLEGHSQLNTLAWQLRDRLPGWDINNVAIGGTGLHGWADQVGEKFEGAYRPGVQNIALVAGGDNTIGNDDAQVERAEKNYQRWCENLRKKGFKVIVSTTPPRKPYKETPLYDAHRQKLNTWLREHYKEFADGLYDIDNIKELSDPTNLKYYKPDGVHLTIGAYELTATEIAKVIQALAKGDRK